MIVLKKRPQGEPTADCFETVPEVLAPLREGAALYETLLLSVDPYLRGRMNEGKSYVPPFAIGEAIASAVVGRVLESRHGEFHHGDLITGQGPWAERAIASGPGWKKIPPGAPPSAFLGVLGMPGLTAYVGLLDVGALKNGETVVVSAASGAVGSLVVQLAKLRGCRTIGIAGGSEKCAYVVKELGADACLDHRGGDLVAGLRRELPNGIDVYFDNVGGDVLKAVLANLRDHARIAICGMIADYNATSLPSGPYLLPLLVHKARIEGFIVAERWNRYPAFFAEIAPLVQSGKIKFREDIAEGLANAPQALFNILKGKNFGKQLVRVKN